MMGTKRSWNKNSETPRDYSKEHNPSGSKEQEERNRRKRHKRKHDKIHGECPEGTELHHVNGIENSEVECVPISQNRGRKEKSRIKDGEIVIRIKKDISESSFYGDPHSAPIPKQKRNVASRSLEQIQKEFIKTLTRKNIGPIDYRSQRELEQRLLDVLEQAIDSKMNDIMDDYKEKGKIREVEESRTPEGETEEGHAHPLYFLGEEINPRTLLEIELQEQGRATWGDIIKMAVAQDPKGWKKRGMKIAKSLGTLGIGAAMVTQAPAIMGSLGLAGIGGPVIKMLIDKLGKDYAVWTTEKITDALKTAGGATLGAMAPLIAKAADKLTGSGNPLRHLNISDNLTNIVDDKIEEEFYTYLKGYFKANQKDPNEEVPANWINKKFRDWLVNKFEGYTIAGPVSNKLLPDEPD